MMCIQVYDVYTEYIVIYLNLNIGLLHSYVIMI